MPTLPSPSGGTPRRIADLLRLLVQDPGRPRLTWYDDDGRVELSGAVLENWANKTANLLVEEFDAGPNVRIVIDLPVHWRTAVWALATWRVGATAVLGGDGTSVAGVPGGTGAAGAASADLVVTTRPGAWATSGAEVVAVSLPALARAFDGELPAGAIDAASAVMTYGDQLGWVPETDPRAVAWTDLSGTSVAHADLLAPADGTPTARRLLVDGQRPVAAVLGDLLAIWGAGGSAVLLSASMREALDRDPARRRRLLDGERVDPAG